MLKLRKRHKTNKFIILLYIVIISLLCSFLLIKYISKKLGPTLITYAESEVKKLTIMILNKSVDISNLSNKLNDLYKIEKNSNDEINLITYNSVIVMDELGVITNKAWDYLKLLEKGELDKLEVYSYNTKYKNKGIILEIPLGLITDSILLSNLGYKIPVKISIVGNISGNIETSVKEYGINNVIVEVGVNVAVNIKIFLPFISKDIKISTFVPISIKVIPGKIPYYYMDGYNLSSSMYRLPIE